MPSTQSILWLVNLDFGNCDKHKFVCMEKRGCGVKPRDIGKRNGDLSTRGLTLVNWSKENRSCICLQDRLGLLGFTASGIILVFCKSNSQTSYLLFYVTSSYDLVSGVLDHFSLKFWWLNTESMEVMFRLACFVCRGNFVLRCCTGLRCFDPNDVSTFLEWKSFGWFAQAILLEKFACSTRVMKTKIFKHEVLYLSLFFEL